MSLSIRLSDEERYIIQEQAARAGKPVSTYCRDVLLDYEVQNTLPRQEIAKIMCEYHNQINDSISLIEARNMLHEMEEKIWPLIEL